MRTVHKTSLDLTAGTQRVALPSDANVVRVAAQHEHVTLWYETDTDTDTVMLHSMRIIGTGDRVPPEWIYLGTAEIDQFIFHVYEARIPGRTYP